MSPQQAFCEAFFVGVSSWTFFWFALLFLTPDKFYDWLRLQGQWSVVSFSNQLCFSFWNHLFAVNCVSHNMSDRADTSNLKWNYFSSHRDFQSVLFSPVLCKNLAAVLESPTTVYSFCPWWYSGWNIFGTQIGYWTIIRMEYLKAQFRIFSLLKPWNTSACGAGTWGEEGHNVN